MTITHALSLQEQIKGLEEQAMGDKVRGRASSRASPYKLALCSSSANCQFCPPTWLDLSMHLQGYVFGLAAALLQHFGVVNRTGFSGPPTRDFWGYWFSSRLYNVVNQSVVIIYFGVLV